MWMSPKVLLCSLLDDETQVTCERPTAPCSKQFIWVILFLIFTPPTYSSEEEIPECRLSTPHPSNSEEQAFAKKTKEYRIRWIKDEMRGGGGREVSSHNVLSQRVCQQTKQALWKQFSFLCCWIGLNILCSYCLSFDSRIIGYKTMKFCPNMICSRLMQKVVCLHSPPAFIRKMRSNTAVTWVNILQHTLRGCAATLKVTDERKHLDLWSILPFDPPLQQGPGPLRQICAWLWNLWLSSWPICKPQSLWCLSIE